VLARLLLLFTIVPLVELWLLVGIAHRTSIWFTLVLVLGTGFLGAALARREGLRCWHAARRQVARGELPTDSLLDGLMVLVAGALLIAPGVLTDLAGLALLMPRIRSVVRRYLVRWYRARMIVTGPGWREDDECGDTIIDARVIETDSRKVNNGP
jgi:UPF0716 protein FxsA